MYGSSRRQEESWSICLIGKVGRHEGTPISRRANLSIRHTEQLRKRTMAAVTLNTTTSEMRSYILYIHNGTKKQTNKQFFHWSHWRLSGQRLNVQTAGKRTERMVHLFHLPRWTIFRVNLRVGRGKFFSKEESQLMDAEGRKELKCHCVAAPNAITHAGNDF